jgi:RNA polymerase sigma factor (sigma-70 family)
VSSPISPARDEELAELVIAAQHGDDIAFAALVGRFQRLAVALALGWLGDIELARDAAQEAFLDAHLHLADLRDPAAFGAWLRRIVAKHCDRMTRRHSWMDHHATLVDAEAEAVADGAPGPEANLERRDEARAVRTALERLPPRQRVVIALHYLGGYGQTEIAVALGIPLTTVKKRAHDARGTLREELAVIRTTLQVEGTDGLAPFSDEVELFLAIRRGDSAAVAALLLRRPDLVRQHEGWPASEAHRARLPYARQATALIRAAERGDLAIVRLLVEAGAAVDDMCGCTTGETPLWAATVTDCPDVVAYLLEHGADPNVRGTLGHTALHVAAMRGWPHMVEKLLVHGADPRATDEAGRTALDWADLKGHAHVQALLRAARAGERPRGVVAEQRHQQPVSSTAHLCETGIKVIDLFGALCHGDLVRVDGDIGLGLVVLLGELTMALEELGYDRALWTGFEQPLLNRSELDHALGESGRRGMARLALVPPELEGEEAQGALARILGQWQHDRAGSTKRQLVIVFQTAGHLATVEAVQPHFTRRGPNGATAFVVAPETFPPQGAHHQQELPPGVKVHLRFDAARARRGLYPALNPIATTSINVSAGVVGAEHAAVAREARLLLADYARIDPELAFPEPASLPPEQRTDALRAQRLHAWLTQPFLVAEPFTGRPGVRVSRESTVRGVARILRGELNDVPVDHLRYIGDLD